MKLELNYYSFFRFQIKECQNYIQTFLKYEEITDLNNTVLQFLNQSLDVYASKKSRNSPNLEAPHISCSRSQNILQDIQKIKQFFLAPKEAQCITTSQPTQKSTHFPEHAIQYSMYSIYSSLN